MGDWRDLYMNIRPEAGNHVRMDAFAALQLITKAAYTIQLFDELQSYLVSEYETTTEYHTFFDHMCEYTLLCHLKKVYEAMPKVPSIQVLHSKILAYSTTMRDAYEASTPWCTSCYEIKSSCYQVSNTAYLVFKKNQELPFVGQLQSLVFAARY